MSQETSGINSQSDSPPPLNILVTGTPSEPQTFTATFLKNLASPSFFDVMGVGGSVLGKSLELLADAGLANQLQSNLALTKWLGLSPDAPIYANVHGSSRFAMCAWPSATLDDSDSVSAGGGEVSELC